MSLFRTQMVLAAILLLPSWQVMAQQVVDIQNYSTGQTEFVEPEPSAQTGPVYGGPLGERSFFTGDWYGKRTALADSGFTFSGDITNYYHGITSGGLNQHFKFGGHSDYIFDFDMSKISGAEGLFIRARGETQYGEFINGDTGALLAANTSGLVPTTGEQKTALTELTLTQFVSETTAVFFGKVQTFDGDLNAFASGRGKTQFMNVAMVANPIAFRTVPYSSWGLGVVVLGEEQTPVFSLTVIDPINRATTFDLDDMFSEGATLNFEVRKLTNFFSKPGHQLIGGTWGSRDVTLLSDAARLLLPGGTAATVTDSWSLYWNFDQYLFMDPCNEGKGWGVFGRAAVADDETNPLEWFLSFGVGGDSRIAGRTNDTFGAGFYYGATSDELPALLLDGDGSGFEMFYNAEVTPWFHFTTDLQVLDPGTTRIDDSLLIGFRGKIDY